MRNIVRPGLIAGISAAALAAAAHADEIDEVTLSVVGSWSSLPLYQQYESRYWTETLPELSEGRITVEMTTFDQLGSDGSDVYRMLSDGVYDVGMTVADYTVSDAPELEALDVPLVALEADFARETVEVARDWVADSMRERFDSQLLAIAPYPPQIVFCRDEVAGLEDLADRRVRGSGRMTTQFLEALGAEGVNIGFGEVPGALERGVIDCAITGAGSGYNAGWWESTTHLLVLPLGGWDPVITAMNLDRWESLSPATQELIQESIIAEFEDPAWEDAQGALERDLACLSDGDCEIGENAGMTIVEATDEDMQAAVEVLTDSVLPAWAGRTDDDYVDRWNDTVGELVDIRVE